MGVKISMHPIRYVAAAIIISLAMMTASRALAEDNRGAAPFGLQWGMSSAQARAIGVVLTEDTHKNYGITYIATKLPKIIADIQTVLLSFGFDDKLWRIVAVSKDFSNDPYGAAVQKRYDELATELSEKYGRGDTESGASDEFFSDPKNFVYAIQSGNAWRYTNYNTSLLSIQLGINASDLSIAFYHIIFENNTLRAGFDKGKRTNEKKAL
jgi:hypothetical protein